MTAAVRVRPHRPTDRLAVEDLLASTDRGHPSGCAPTGIDEVVASGAVLVATTGGRVEGLAAWSATAAWRRATLRRAIGRVRGRPPAGSRTRASPGARDHSPAWDRRAADLAARRRWFDTDPGLGRLTALAVAGGSAPTEAALLAGVADAARSAGIRRLDACLADDDPLVSRLADLGWMTGSAMGMAVCSTLVSLPWRQDTSERPRRSRLGRSLAAVRPGRVPALAAMATEELWGTVRTGGGTAPRSPGAADPERGWHAYEAARHRTIRRTLALVPAAMRRTAFVDLGCGRGRALTHASRVPFSRVVGVERDPDLAADARRLNPDPRVEVVEADATTWTVPRDVGVVYLFNPFGSEGLAAVAHEVRDSIDRRPRPMLVLLANPRRLGPFLEVGFDLVHAEPLVAVLAIAPGRAGPASDR